MVVQKKGILILLLFVTTLIWTAGLSRPDGRTHFWTVASKGKVSLIVRSPLGNFAIINPSIGVIQELGYHLPFYQREISLVILTEAKPSPVLDQLNTRYSVIELWGNITDQNIPKSTSFKFLTGEKILSWEGLTFKTWSLPDQDSYVSIVQGKNSLALSGSNGPGFLESVPNLEPVEILIETSKGKKPGLTPQLLQQLQPRLLLAEGVPGSQVIVSSPYQREIVWSLDSWYIDPSR